MATIPTLAELKPAYQSAPDMVRTYIQSEELARVFEEIRTVHKIHFDEAGQISLSLNAVFLGVRRAGEFTNLLKVSLEQNSDKYDAILNDVNEKIFKVFRYKLEHKDDASTGTQAAAPASPAAPSHAPVSSPSPHPLPAKTPLERLESGTAERAEPVALPADTPEPTREALAKKPYTGTDPYRESVE